MDACGSGRVERPLFQRGKRTHSPRRKNIAKDVPLLRFGPAGPFEDLSKPMMTPIGSRKDLPSPDSPALDAPRQVDAPDLDAPRRADPSALDARRRADAEARRAIEEANRLAQEREAAYRARLAEKQAFEQEEAEEKRAAARAKAAAKSEAMRVKAEMREAAVREKARARAEQTAAKEAQAAERDAQRAGRSEEKTRLQVLKSRMRDEIRAQTKELGAPLAELIAGYLKVFARRADIFVLRHDVSSPMELDVLLEYADLPIEILAFYHQLGAVDFGWGFENEGPNAGALRVPPVSELCPIDVPKGPTKTGVALHASAASAGPLRQLVLPLARRAFVTPDRNAVLERLEECSAHRWSTPACLADAFVSKGLSQAQAKILVACLGEEARLLLGYLDTGEGRRRDELMKAVDVSDGTIHRRLLEAINAGPALEKIQWQKLVADHRIFLEQGGGGGDFEFRVQNGLPSLLYRGPSVPGQALLSCENLNGAKFDGAKLASAGLAGVRGEQVSFAKADLSHASLVHSVLNGAKFNAARLVRCDFSSCRLAGATFRGADLTGTNFERADLTGANFAGALIKETRFGGALIRDVKY